MEDGSSIGLLWSEDFCWLSSTFGVEMVSGTFFEESRIGLASSFTEVCFCWLSSIGFETDSGAFFEESGLGLTSSLESCFFEVLSSFGIGSWTDFFESIACFLAISSKK